MGGHALKEQGKILDSTAHQSNPWFYLVKCSISIHKYDYLVEKRHILVVPYEILTRHLICESEIPTWQILWGLKTSQMATHWYSNLKYSFYPQNDNERTLSKPIKIHLICDQY